MILVEISISTTRRPSVMNMCNCGEQRALTGFARRLSGVIRAFGGGVEIEEQRYSTSKRSNTGAYRTSSLLASST